MPFDIHASEFEPSVESHELSRWKSFESAGAMTKLPSKSLSNSSLLAPLKNRNTTFSSIRTLIRRHYYHGWQMGVLLCAVITGAVLFINVVLTIWASIKYGLQEGLATIQDGSCQKTKNLSLWLHLAINALSTLLLSASNYTMQCLSSPTREEVDKAHRQQVWLDIGIPSVRNLRRISWCRIILWWLLALSGIPLHLLYNSAVFSSLAAVEYNVYVGSSALINGASVNWSSPIAGSINPLQTVQNASHWQRLDNKDCITAYGRSFVSAYGDLLAISSDLNASVPAIYINKYDAATNFGPSGDGVPYGWICQTSIDDMSKCDINNSLKDSADWTLSSEYGNYISADHYDFRVDYCLSNPVEEHCKLQFSMVIMAIVMGCNLVKAVCMLLTLRYHTDQPLVSSGDAIASFLDNPDPTTVNMCLADKYKFIENDWVPGPRPWEPKRRRWFASASTKRWLTCNLLCLTTLITSAILLTMGTSAHQLTSASFAHLWSLGYGTVTSESMVTWSLRGPSALMIAILVANSPQALLSFLFLTYNGLFTCMLLSEEWSGYAHERKPLRVTSPVGEQRSTYRLQLPYRYGVPLLVLSGLLHWLVSQSLFLARVTAFKADGTEDAVGSISTIGYSCIAIITVILLGAVVVLLGIANGARTYREGMPLVGSCSAAISAACHAPKGEEGGSFKGVMWGSVKSVEGDRVGHCCFSSGEVGKVVEGEVYAGMGARKM